MRKSFSLLVSFFLLTNSYSQTIENKDLSIALETLERTETDVARTIVQTTSVLHRLEKALKLDKLYERAVETPSAVYIGTAGVAFGGLAFKIGGDAIKEVGQSIKSSGESIEGIQNEHQMQLMRNAMKKSGESSLTAGEEVKRVGQIVANFGDAWFKGVAKWTVQSKFSQKVGNILLKFIIKPSQNLVVNTANFSSEAVERSYQVLEGLNKEFFKLILFTEKGAQSIGGALAAGSMLGGSVYLGHMLYTEGALLYEQEFDLSDEEIQEALQFSPEVSQSIDETVNEFSNFFSLSEEKRAILKETITNDLIAHKILEYRNEIPASDDSISSLLPWKADTLQKNREEFEESLRERYNLTEEQVAQKLNAYDELVPDPRQLISVDSNIPKFNVLTSLEKVLDENQLATLATFKALFDVKSMLKSVESSVMIQTNEEVLARMDNQVLTLHIIKAYIAQVREYKNLFDEASIQAVEDLIKEIDEKIKLRTIQKRALAAKK